VIVGIAAIVAVNDLITAVLLFAQYTIVPATAILILAGGYLFTALIVIPQALTFPGAFTPTGMLGANLQSAGHLYLLWHFIAPLSVLFYAYLEDRPLPTDRQPGAVHAAISWCVGIVLAVVLACTWYSVSGYFMLPFFTSATTFVKHAWANAFNAALVLFNVGVLAALWVRRRTLLDYWLLLVVLSIIVEQILLVMLSSTRFSLGGLMAGVGVQGSKISKLSR
jgi:hypothetical protein